MQLKDITFFYLVLLQFGVLASNTEQKFTIGVLDKVGFEMQNAFISNLAERYITDKS